MNLQFFRKHRKLFFVLMILAVFAMVFFSALYELMQMFSGGGRNREGAVVVFNIAGQDVTRARYDEIDFFINQLMRREELRGKLMLTRLANVPTATETSVQNPATRATLILLTEAEKAGVGISDQVAPEQFENLSRAD